MAKYGYTGAKPTQSSSSNSGVFGVNDVVELLKQGKYKLQSIPVSYLVIAGGGGGGGSLAGAGGGGGAGGYRSSYSGDTNSGRLSSVEDTLGIIVGDNYSVTVGAGAAADTQGNDSVFDSITSLGGGLGGHPTQGLGASGGSGGGHGAFSNTNYNTSNPAGTAGQGFDGGASGGPGSSGGLGGGGGGAGANGEDAQTSGTNHAGYGGNGLSSSINGSATTRAGGGGGGKNVFSSGATGLGGSGGGGTGLNINDSASKNATVNTGSGGGGARNSVAGGTGGSGIVILRYSNIITITIGGGLTVSTSETAIGGSDNYVVLTGGTDNVSWSLV